MEKMRGLYVKFLVTAVFAGLFALTGCAGSGTVASSQFTPQQVTVNGAVNPVVGKLAAKDVAAAVGSTGTVTVVDALTGATISTTSADIVNNQFSATFNVTAPKTAVILVAKLTGTNTTYRTLIPLDLSNAPAGLTVNYPLTGLLVGPKSEAIVQAVQATLNVTGSLGIDSGVAFPHGTDFTAVSSAVLANGGGVVAYGSTGITINGTMEAMATQLQIVYTSDTHYGIKKTAFSGMSSAQQVNGAMIAVMNTIEAQTLPSDGGINSGMPVGAVDFVAHTGDTLNRSEGAIYPYKNAPASAMWAQFQADYFNVLNLKNRSGAKAPLLLTTGNHETSNAIGYYKSGTVLDATAYANIYNFMMAPATAMTNASFTGTSTPVPLTDTANYTTYSATAKASYATPANRIVTSRDMNGVHFLFVGMYPDSISRPLVDADLKNVPATTPVVLFTHAPPVGEAKLYTNPVSPNTINSTNKFENLLSDVFAEATPLNTPYSDAAGTTAIPNTIEQRVLVTWLKTHKNIVAWFHGHDNANEFYSYTGPDNDINLPTFRVDSPMKGNVSVGDPTKLSFQVITIDPLAKKLTVREYLWFTKAWGASQTISLAPRNL